MNNKEPVKEYSRLLKIDKEEFLKDPSEYSFTSPLALVGNNSETFIKELLVDKNNRHLISAYVLKENSIMNVLKYDEKKTFNTIHDSLKKINEVGKPAITIFSSCCSRRLVLKDKESKEINDVINKFKKNNFFGFFSFSEIGSTKTSQAQVHSFTVTNLTIYDKLLTE